MEYRSMAQFSMHQIHLSLHYLPSTAALFQLVVSHVKSLIVWINLKSQTQSEVAVYFR